MNTREIIPCDLCHAIEFGEYIKVDIVVTVCHLFEPENSSELHTILCPTCYEKKVLLYILAIRDRTRGELE